MANRKRQALRQKEKRSWWLSDEAFLLLQALAAENGVDVPPYLEMTIRNLATTHLSPTQRERIKQEAEALSAKRHQATPTAPS